MFELIALGVVILDQISKFYAENVITNTGAAFGFFQGYQWLFITVGFLVLFVILYYRKRLKGLSLWGSAFLFGGTIGNLIDRMVFGHVRDFITIWIWPSFNIADSFNVIGVGLLIWYFWKK